MLNFFRRRKNLFIHIPKTGGSSFVGLLKESAKLTDAEMKIPSHVISAVKDTEVCHIDFKSVERRFKRPDIFEPQHWSKLKKKYRFFMLVRQPVDRLVSEFNFQFHILNGKSGNKAAGIIARLPKRPKNIEQYVGNPHVSDYQVKFLLGRKLADPRPVMEDEFQRVLQAINDLPINCGITEQYADFLNLFRDKSKVNLHKELVVRKKTPDSIKSKLKEKTRELILQNNTFDLRLYQFVKDNLNQNVGKEDFVFKQSNEFTV